MRIAFLGAAQTVSGSCYLIEDERARVLVDCGAFIGDDGNNALPIDPTSLDAVVITHAHYDHIGRLPLLVAAGYRGPIIATKTTAELAGIMLLDAAAIARRKRSGRGGEPTFDEADVLRTFECFAPQLPYRARHRVAPGWQVTLHRAGHIFGSAHVVFDIDGRRVVFSGDIGRPRPIIDDPDPPRGASVLVMESTYGDRDHAPDVDTRAELRDAIAAAQADDGCVVIPSFALGRAQEIVYHLNDLAEAGDLPGDLRVFVDSPLSARVTRVVEQNPQIFDADMLARIEGDDPFAFRGLRFVRSGRTSRDVDTHAPGAVVIAGSGMCTGGRVVGHLRRALPDPASHVLFTGYAAPGTPASQIIDGAPWVSLDGRRVERRARVHVLGGLSGHADRSELSAWARVAATRDTSVFVTHGAPRSARSLAVELRRTIGCSVDIPAAGAVVSLD